MKKAVVIFSGGLDSATCIALAKQQAYEVYALTFNYQQRAQAEINAAIRSAQHLGVKQHKVFDINIGQFNGSALTDLELEVPTDTESAAADIPITYVPARNTIMLSVALGWAEVLGAHDIFYGANDVDYSGYPDCRPEYVDAFNVLANLATKDGVSGNPFKIHAPLLQLHKHEIIKLGIDLGVDYSLTVSCYQPDFDGRACGKCESCAIRARGFERAGVEDVTLYTATAVEQA